MTLQHHSYAVYNVVFSVVQKLWWNWTNECLIKLLMKLLISFYLFIYLFIIYLLIFVSFFWLFRCFFSGCFAVFINFFLCVCLLFLSLFFVFCLFCFAGGCSVCFYFVFFFFFTCFVLLIFSCLLFVWVRCMAHIVCLSVSGFSPGSLRCQTLEPHPSPRTGTPPLPLSLAEVCLRSALTQHRWFFHITYKPTLELKTDDSVNDMHKCCPWCNLNSLMAICFVWPAVSESDSDRSASPPPRRESPKPENHSRYKYEFTTWATWAANTQSKWNLKHIFNINKSLNCLKDWSISSMIGNRETCSFSQPVPFFKQLSDRMMFLKLS